MEESKGSGRREFLKRAVAGGAVAATVQPPAARASSAACRRAGERQAPALVTPT